MAEFAVDELIEEIEESATDDVVDDIPETEEPASEEVPSEESIPEESVPEESEESVPVESVQGESASGESVPEAEISGIDGSASMPGTSTGNTIESLTGAALPEAGSDQTSSVVYDNAEVIELLTSIQETQALQLASSQRIEVQFEAVISILLIIVVVGLLHYIYRFLKLFF